MTFDVINCKKLSVWKGQQFSYNIFDMQIDLNNNIYDSNFVA